MKKEEYTKREDSKAYEGKNQNGCEKESHDKKENINNEAEKEETAEDKLAAAEAQIDELKDKNLRQVAEFDNYRKRTMKEKADLILNGAEKTITAILPILDDMERALKNMDKMEDVKAVKEGVDLIFQKFVKILGEQGVKKIETKEAAFNTDLHEAIAQVPAPSDDMKGKVVDCVKTGYTLNEKVIRHAQVAVGL
ncbi:MAG: nucleotide exchange factor GrpE [Paraprevotella sp.]|nr:nucleotide exchange factor GrpE [Paraprevotella sp.]